MKTNRNFSLVALCALSLVALPAAFANHDADFKKMDTDGDGFISQAEHAAAATAMFAEMDTNHDGNVTSAEMTACMELKGHDSDRAAMSAADMFQQCDANGDGQVTAAEHLAASDAMFAKMDTNHDGKLSKDECKAGYKAMKKANKS